MGLLPLGKNFFLFGGGVTSFGQLAGPLVLPSRGIADANAAFSATDGVLYPSSLTAARVFTLPPASAFTLAVIADPDQLVTAAHTISYAANNGTDQINGSNANGVALNAAGQVAMFWSDGVSKITMTVDGKTALVGSNNLSDVASASTSRTNLGVPPIPTGFLVSTTAVTNATFNIPPGSTYVMWELIGGGGSGGGGFAAATGGGGGGGGQGSHVGPTIKRIADLATVAPTQLFYTIGAGQTGGASGTQGTNGGDTTLGLTTGPGNIIATAKGGIRGQPGTAGAGGTGGGQSNGVSLEGPNTVGANGAAGGAPGAAGGNGGNASGTGQGVSGGGGGGGGATNGTTETAGGTGGGVNGGTSGAAGTNPGGNATDISASFGGVYMPYGSSGGGGGGNHAGTGGAGGNGQVAGGAGGGGGAGTTGGAGGNSGAGGIKIVCW